MQWEHPEYSRSDDFDPPGAEWVSMDIVGSPYQEQLDVLSQPARWRHRSSFELGPWKEGPAPQ